jgi:hypothetical protein
MSPAVQRFVAVLTLAIFAVASVTCACAGPSLDAVAIAHKIADDDARPCCAHHQNREPAPRTPADDQREAACQHCRPSVGLEPPAHAKLSSFDPAIGCVVAPVAIPSPRLDAIDHVDVTPRCGPSGSATLLRLHCALNS